MILMYSCVCTHQEGAEEDEGDKVQVGELAPAQGTGLLVLRQGVAHFPTQAG